MNKPQEALKPCPFCGAKADMGHSSYSGPDHEGKWKSDHWYSAGCNNCHISTNKYREQDDAIKFWNTRAALESSSSMVRASYDDLMTSPEIALDQPPTESACTSCEGTGWMGKPGADTKCPFCSPTESGMPGAQELVDEFVSRNDSEDYPFKGEEYDINLVKFAFEWLLNSSESYSVSRADLAPSVEPVPGLEIAIKTEAALCRDDKDGYQLGGLDKDFWLALPEKEFGIICEAARKYLALQMKEK